MNQNTFEPQVSSGSQGQPTLRRALMLIIVGVVVLAAIAAGAWWIYGERETSKEIAPGQTIFTPQAGNVVAKFPAELILENSPQIVKSYRIEYSAGNIKQPFVRYISGKSFAENVDLFTKYFQDNQWEMLRMGSVAESPNTFFEGAKNGNEVNVILKEESGKVEVSIAYTLNP